MAKQAIDKKTQEMPLQAPWPAKDEALRIMEAIKLDMSELERQRTYLLRDMAELESQGIEFFGTTWKDGKYLYKLYPSTAGEARRRVYVGADEATCKQELDKLERYNKHASLKRDVQRLESKLEGSLQYMRWARLSR